MAHRRTRYFVLAVSLLLGTTAFGQDEPSPHNGETQLAGWQIEAFLPSNISPALSWDCFELPKHIAGFARGYVDQVYMQSGCEIRKDVSVADTAASVTIQCGEGTREFEFKRTTGTTIGIKQIETDAGGTRNQYLTLMKQCDATVEFDCSEQGKVAWRATRPAQAVNYACGESGRQTEEASAAGNKPDFGFSTEMKTFEVMRGREGEHPNNGLPEQCNWYLIDGNDLCYTATDLEMFVDYPHALSLANIAIELRVGEREFTGSKQYCDDVDALAAQMPWMKGVSCEIAAE